MSFKINGKSYEGAKYDFNTHCEFDAMGVNAMEITTKPAPVLRAYFAISTGMSVTEAGNELEKHFLNGGKFDELTAELIKEMDRSDFFMTMIEKAKESLEETENQTEETPDSQEKTKRVRSTKKKG